VEREFEEGKKCSCIKLKKMNARENLISILITNKKGEKKGHNVHGNNDKKVREEK